MTKNSHLRPIDRRPSETVIDASQNKWAMETFNGKSMYEIGAELDLYDEDLSFGYSKNPKTNEEIKSLLVKVKDQKFRFNFSKGSNAGELDNLDECGNWVFRAGHLRMKDESGEPVADGEHGPVLDMTKPYITFGKPGGFVMTREEAAFSEIGAKEESLIA